MFMVQAIKAIPASCIAGTEMVIHFYLIRIRVGTSIRTQRPSEQNTTCRSMGHPCPLG